MEKYLSEHKSDLIFRMVHRHERVSTVNYHISLCTAVMPWTCSLSSLITVIIYFSISTCYIHLFSYIYILADSLIRAKMKEEFLHYLWKYSLYDPEKLSDNEGNKIIVINPGDYNRDSGPDFFNARISIGGYRYGRECGDTYQIVSF